MSPPFSNSEFRWLPVVLLGWEKAEPFCLFNYHPLAWPPGIHDSPTLRGPIIPHDGHVDGFAVIIQRSEVGVQLFTLPGRQLNSEENILRGIMSGLGEPGCTAGGYAFGG